MSNMGGTRIRRRGEPQISDRWMKANAQVCGLFSAVVAHHWWITPNADLGGRAPIQTWEEGRPGEIEDLLRTYRRAAA